MAVSFPTSPNVGDTVTDAGSGAVWVWDGKKWTHAPGGGAGSALPDGTANGQVLTWNGTAWTAAASVPTVPAPAR